MMQYMVLHASLQAVQCWTQDPYSLWLMILDFPCTEVLRLAGWLKHLNRHCRVPPGSSVLSMVTVSDPLSPLYPARTADFVSQVSVQGTEDTMSGLSL